MIQGKYGEQPELIKGVNGVFDVVAGDVLIFSKHREGRFPDDDEVMQSLARLMPG